MWTGRGIRNKPVYYAHLLNSHMKNWGDGVCVWVCVCVHILTASQGSEKCGNYIHNRESACNAGDQGLIHESERSPGEGNFDSVQYSRLENSMDGGPWQAIVHKVAKNWMQLSSKHFHIYDSMSYRQWNVCMFHSDCTCMYIIHKEVMTSQNAESSSGFFNSW